MDDRILVTGTRGGIGRYIHERLGGLELTRQSNNLTELRNNFFDLIVHCACNHSPSHNITGGNLAGYYYDNVTLTEEVLRIPHRYFVFFSTVDVYPGDGQAHQEDEVIQADSVRSFYGITKLISESAVKNRAKNFLILRPAFLLGPYMRINNISKLFRDSSPILSLDSGSLYNAIRYEDVFGFIRLAIAQDKTGTFNLASTGNVSLAKIADIAGKKAVFGSHHYETGNIINHKTVEILPAFSKTSEEAVRIFMRDHQI